ncbi:MAG: ornithine carbamoyltransferase [Neisseria sp.]|uniref:ornithine carbamoyltransferase n=1 Tax=Neisseria sp. TaxID=192066 RepID=UPI0026DCC826|nr:ornithine carbamoyltransferase [Neisseria sp.]MDO4640715.1 ornithine carbamoyltransferase [Neisseria sp.]
MSVNLHNRHFLKLLDFSREEILSLLDLAAKLKTDKKAGRESRRLTGKNIALIFEKTSTRTRCSFEVAAHDQGANVTYLGPSGSQIGHKESMKDTARVLGRMYDGIEYRGFGQSIVEELAEYAGVPVFNGLTDEFHPTQMLADMLTMREHSDKPIEQIAYAYVGDARFNMGNSFLLTGAILGMDVRIGAPKHLWPAGELIQQAHELAKKTGARVLLTENAEEAVKGADYIHTDVWVSMGEPEEIWKERIGLLMPFRVTSELMAASGNPNVKFMHCLPAFHNRETAVGEWIYQNFGLDGVEVTEDVFESEASIVFDQAENRMHTIKAVLVATMSENV